MRPPILSDRTKVLVGSGILVWAAALQVRRMRIDMSFSLLCLHVEKHLRKIAYALTCSRYFVIVSFTAVRYVINHRR